VRLYYRPGTGRPVRVAWTLEELGVPYEPVAVTPEEVEGAEYRSGCHPLGRVPALEEDGRTTYESTGLVFDLADRHPDGGLMPAIGSADRRLVYQWAIMAMTEVEKPLVEVLVHGQSDPARGEAGVAAFKASVTPYEEALGSREYLVGDSLTAADIVSSGVLAIGRLASLLDDLPNVNAYVSRNFARPAFQRAATATASLIQP
jgi:glutathione S-transferase